MNKTEYIEKLKVQLSGYPKDFIDELIDNFENHINDGIAKGQSEEEVIEKFGTVEEVVAYVQTVEPRPTVKNSYNSFGKEDLKLDFDFDFSDFKEFIKKLSRGIEDTFTNIANLHYEDPFTSKVDNLNDVDTLMIKTDRCSGNIAIERGNELIYHYQRALPVKEDDSLKVGVSGNSVVFNPSNNDFKLRIELPSSITNIVITSLSSDVNIESLQLDKALIELTSGDIRISNTTGSLLKVTTISGDIDVENSSIGLIQSSTTSGDIDISRSIGELELNSTSGDVEVRNHNGESASIATISGDIDANIQNIQELKISSTSGDVDIDLYDDDFTAKIRTSSGDIDYDSTKPLPFTKVTNRDFVLGNGNKQYEISTVSGDIAIDIH